MQDRFVDNVSVAPTGLKFIFAGLSQDCVCPGGLVLG